MKTRYAEMILWTTVHLIFCLCIIEIYSVINKKNQGLKINAVRAGSVKFYMQDFFIALLLVIIVGIRCNSGSDYYNYYTMYVNCNEWYHGIQDVFLERFQNGYMALSYITKNTLGGDYTIFFLVAIIIYFPTVHMIRQYSDSPVISFASWVMLGFLPMTTNIIKQSIAMVCILGAWFLLIDKKYVRFVMLAILAAFFHSSSMYILIIMLISSKINPTVKLFIEMLLSGTIIMICMAPLLSYVGRIVPERYAVYIDSALNDEQDLKLRLGGIFVTVSYFVILYLCIKKYEGRNWKQSRLLSVCIMCIPFLFLGSRYYLFNRLAYYGMQFIPFLVPNCFCRNTSQGKIKLRTEFSLALVAFCLVFNVLCAENNYYHYGTIFTEEPLSVLDFVQERNQDGIH